MRRLKKIKNLTQSTAAAAVAAGALALGGIAAAPASEITDLGIAGEQTPLERNAKAAKLVERYENVYEEAEKLEVAPNQPAIEQRIGVDELRPKLKRLERNVAQAKRNESSDANSSNRGGSGSDAKANGKSFPDPKSVGVSMQTLESIAACESGGDPNITSPDGTYRGKYQFDRSTWASVGGEGDPAAAPEAEQDYRAALLYSRAGHSPWPVCGS